MYVVNNNHFEGKAAANAAMLQSQVTGKRVRVPETLYQTYRKDLEPLTTPDRKGTTGSLWKEGT